MTSPITPAGAGPSGGGERAEILKASQDFEAIFLHQLLQEMRSSLHQSWDVSGGGFGAGLVQDMCDGELANHIAKARGMGLADVIAGQLTKEGKEIL